METVVPDVGDHLVQAFGEFLEVFLIEEDLVLVIVEGPVRIVATLALRDGEIEVLAALGGLDVEEVGPLPGPDGLGKYILRIPAVVPRRIIILSVHSAIFSVYLLDKIVYLSITCYLCKQICLKVCSTEEFSVSRPSRPFTATRKTTV